MTMSRLAALATAATLLLPSAATAQERSYVLTLTQSEIHYIGAVLDEQKHKDVNDLLKKIQAQMDQQNQASQAAAIEAIKKTERQRIESEKAANPPTSEGPKP
jgi:ABC-type sugar transport system substrate-binding protein